MMSASSLRPESHSYPKEGLSSQVRRGLDYFVGLYDGTSLKQEDRRLVSSHMERILISRTKRASEISTSNYLKVIDLLMTPKENGGIFNNPDIFGVDCIDGRVLPVFVAGIIAKFGGMIRVPAGDLTEMKKRSGVTDLVEGSNFAKRLNEAFKNRRTNKITQIFDSHLFCAAREKDENARNRFPADHGLYADVKRKKEMAGAAVRYVEKQNGKRTVSPIQLSFDPHTGYIYMGLETDKSMKEAEKHGNVFFDEREASVRKGESFNLLKKMALDGDILSTELLSKDPAIKTALDQERLTDIDWENHYSRTAVNFWGKIAKLQKTSVYTSLKIKLAAIYPEIAKSPDGKAEIEDRATIALANLFGTYCLRKGGTRPFPHEEHKEEIGVASEGGYGPFSEIPSFAINIHDEDNLSVNARLAYDIILSNRKKKNISTRENAPVVIMVEHILRTGPKDPIWKALTDADLQKQLRSLPDIPFHGKNWLDWNDSEFYNCLKANFNIKDSKIAQELNKLRHAMIALYKRVPNKSGDPLKDESLFRLFPQFKSEKDNRPRLILLPVLADQNRSVQAIIPFIKN
jgi:hypothetical protein